MFLTPTKSLRPTYATVNLCGIKKNINKIRQCSKSDIIAIIKANAYGHGAVAVAKYANKECNIKNFGVATLLEGVELSEKLQDVDSTIYILGYVDSVFFDEVINNKLTLTIIDEQYAKRYHDFLRKKNIKANVAIKIDTGMNRLGFDSSLLNLNDFISNFSNFNVVHIMSHMSSSDTDKEYSLFQKKIFDDFINKYPNLQITTSLFNSSAVASLHNDYDFVRPGLSLFGYTNGSNNKTELDRVMNIQSKIVHIKQLAKGSKIGYNGTYIATSPMLIGVVPIGYADGYKLSLSNNSFMYIDGNFCPVVGKVCMDMTMIDISKIGYRAYEKEVEIMGEHISATDLALSAMTNEYEILCGISDRIPRIYNRIR